jgi:hypothetical protein
VYRITKDGASLGMTEAPTYIKQAPNGCLVLCPENEAMGIAHEGQVYSLLGREPLPDAPTIMLEQVDGGAEVQKASETGGIMFVTLAEGGQIDPATAAEHTELFAPWACPVNYTAGQIRQHGGKLYKCLQAHASQEGWTPDAAPSLWVAISDPAEEWPAWSQPIGAQDAYPLGAKVSHKEKRWISTADNNVWEPGVYGWEEAQEDGI